MHLQSVMLLTAWGVKFCKFSNKLVETRNFEVFWCGAGVTAKQLCGFLEAGSQVPVC